MTPEQARREALLEAAAICEAEARAAVSIPTKRHLRRVAVRMKKIAERPLDPVSGA